MPGWSPDRNEPTSPNLCATVIREWALTAWNGCLLMLPPTWKSISSMPTGLPRKSRAMARAALPRTCSRNSRRRRSRCKRAQASRPACCPVTEMASTNSKWTWARRGLSRILGQGPCARRHTYRAKGGRADSPARTRAPDLPRRVFSSLIAAQPMPNPGRQLVKPPALRPGDTIGIVAPASNLKQTDLGAGCAALRAAGYKTFYLDSILDRDLYFAGRPERRLRELEEMFEREEVRAILCARGGYGATYLLQDLDWKKIASHPK